MARHTFRNAAARMVVILLICSVPSFSEERSAGEDGPTMKPPARMPFLVAGEMPHLTGILKQHWDDPDLGLTPAQKAVLLEIRKSTMAAVTGLATELDPLETSLAKQAMEGAPPETLTSLVHTISDLKTQATMVHLKCIHDTMKFLDDRQLAWVLELSAGE